MGFLGAGESLEQQLQQPLEHLRREMRLQRSEHGLELYLVIVRVMVRVRVRAGGRVRAGARG